MVTKIFRVYISGKISPRLSNMILHKMLEELGYTIGNDQTPTIRNMHRGNEEAYFDVDIPTEDTLSIMELIKNYIVVNSVQYDDITTEPPKDM
jgi:hypothetical protein